MGNFLLLLQALDKIRWSESNQPVRSIQEEILKNEFTLDSDSGSCPMPATVIKSYPFLKDLPMLTSEEFEINSRKKISLLE